MNAFVCICTSVSMFVLSRSSKTLFGAPVEKKWMKNSQLWYLETLGELNMGKK